MAIKYCSKFDDAEEFKMVMLCEDQRKKRHDNKKGDYILEPVYDYIENEKEGLLKVEKNNKCGFVIQKEKLLYLLNT